MKIKKILPLKDYKLKLFDENGVVKIVDIAPYLNKGIAKDVKNPDIFSQASIDSFGGIVWPNGYDICPDQLSYL